MRNLIVTLVLTIPLLGGALPAQAKKAKPAAPTATVTATVPTPPAAPAAERLTATATVPAAPRPPQGASVTVQGTGVAPAQVTVHASPPGQTVTLQTGLPSQTVTVQAVPLYPVVRVTADGYGTPPPPPPPPPGPSCAYTGDSDLSSLIGAIQGESFSSSQLRVLADAAQGRCFLVAQVAEILPLFTFEDDRIKALQLLKPGIVDRQNAFRIYSLFTFEASKEQARHVMSR